jgi:ADP-L-glycero-D-manno-heptose 6-epimerase
MRILVTGGTGFIGSNLVLHLLSEGHDVLITGNDAEQKIPGFKGKYLHPSFHGIHFDSIGHVDVLLHQAAINDTTNLDRHEVMRANLDASKQLFEYVVKNGCKRIVYASSTAVYGDAPAPYKEDGPKNPLNPYAESKILLDEFAMDFAARTGTTIVGLRYCNVYGPRENHKGHRASMIYQLAQQMQHGDPKIFKFGEQRRDYVYVKDVVKANMLAMNAKKSCVVNCGLGKATSFNDLIQVLNAVLGTKRAPMYMENPYSARYQNHTQCDMTKAKELIGFEPDFDIVLGIEDYHKSGFLTHPHQR